MGRKGKYKRTKGRGLNWATIRPPVFLADLRPQQMSASEVTALYKSVYYYYYYY